MCAIEDEFTDRLISLLLRLLSLMKTNLLDACGQRAALMEASNG